MSKAVIHSEVKHSLRVPPADPPRVVRQQRVADRKTHRKPTRLDGLVNGLQADTIRVYNRKGSAEHGFHNTI